MLCYHRTAVLTCSRTGKVSCLQCAETFLCFQEIQVSVVKQNFFKCVQILLRFDIILTVHHSIDLFQITNLMHNSFIL